MFSWILKLPEEVRGRQDVSSLEVTVHADAPCPVPVKEQMIDWWGPGPGPVRSCLPTWPGAIPPAGLKHVADALDQASAVAAPGAT
jgi:hypothetical protein